jgi:hypothetical protein
MKLTPMEERWFGQGIRTKLNASAEQLDRTAVDRLFAARQKALAAQVSCTGELSLAGFGRHALNWCEDNLRPFLLAASLVVAIVCGNYVASVQRLHDLADLDSAVLTDDLPISAYLDNGFHSWLSDTSSQR